MSEVCFEMKTLPSAENQPVCRHPLHQILLFGPCMCFFSDCPRLRVYIHRWVQVSFPPQLPVLPFSSLTSALPHIRASSSSFPLLARSLLPTQLLHGFDLSFKSLDVFQTAFFSFFPRPPSQSRLMSNKENSADGGMPTWSEYLKQIEQDAPPEVEVLFTRLLHPDFY